MHTQVKYREDDEAFMVLSKWEVGGYTPTEVNSFARMG